MNRQSIYTLATIITLIFLFRLSFAQLKDITLTLHLRGVYDSKISLLGLTPAGTFKPVLESPGIKNGETVSLSIPIDRLPGEFVLRFDYREKESSTPYPSEKYIFINNQDLELWVHPMFSNNSDSTWFQPGERENAAFSKFSQENTTKKEKLGVLQNFLMNYDDTDSKLYQEGMREYEKRREEYNSWLEARTLEDKTFFVSSLYAFQYVIAIPWKGSENDRLLSLIDHYFDGIDFKDSLMIRTSDLNRYMNNYVNLYGQMVTTTALRDSLFSLAGQTAIEKARQGHPLVYGWMVDYFYRGYEANGIDAGMKILQPYIDDPNCLTSKRQEIMRRLKGMESLVPGSKAPEILMADPEGNLFQLSSYGVQTKYLLLLFWSADCEHCEQLTSSLYPWQQDPANANKLSVVAISLDETQTELDAWRKKTSEIHGWKHLNAPEGVNSKVAYDYFVLATPVMVLLDARTMEVVDLPLTFNDLVGLMK